MAGKRRAGREDAYRQLITPQPMMWRAMGGGEDFSQKLSGKRQWLEGLNHVTQAVSVQQTRFRVHRGETDWHGEEGALVTLGSCWSTKYISARKSWAGKEMVSCFFLVNDLD